MLWSSHCARNLWASSPCHHYIKLDGCAWRCRGAHGPCNSHRAWRWCWTGQRISAVQRNPARVVPSEVSGPAFMRRGARALKVGSLGAASCARCSHRAQLCTAGAHVVSVTKHHLGEVSSPSSCDGGGVSPASPPPPPALARLLAGGPRATVSSTERSLRTPLTSKINRCCISLHCIASARVWLCGVPVHAAPSASRTIFHKLQRHDGGAGRRQHKPAAAEPAPGRGQPLRGLRQGGRHRIEEQGGRARA